MKKRYSLATALLCLCVALSCGDRTDCGKEGGYVTLTAEVLPYRTEYKVGDTIRLSSKVHKLMETRNYETEELTGRFDLAHIDWRPSTFIYRVDEHGSDKFLHSQLEDFFSCVEAEECSIYRSFYEGEAYSYAGPDYSITGDTLSISFGLIALQPGLFVLHQAATVRTNISDARLPNGCLFYVSYALNPGQDNNIDLLAESPDPYWHTDTRVTYRRDDFERDGRFCFRVVE